MQCPTCGNDTPGTLGKCSHCEAPIDVYSAGPLLSAPPATGPADTLGDRTAWTSPPASSWAPDSPPPVTPDFTMPPSVSTPTPPTTPIPPISAIPGAPPDTGQHPAVRHNTGQHPAVQHSTGQHPAVQHDTGQHPAVQHDTGQHPTVQHDAAQHQATQQTSPEPPAAAQPPLRLSVEPTPAVPPAAPSSVPPADDLEDTAAWTFVPDEDDASGGFSAPNAIPGPSVWSGAQPALPAAEPANAAPAGFGLEPAPEPTESIVPDSWFAKPRKPDAQDVDAPDPDATQIASGPMGFGGDLERTRMDSGSPMGAPPPMSQTPTGLEPAGPGQFGQPQLGPGRMGQVQQGQPQMGMVPAPMGHAPMVQGPGGPGAFAPVPMGQVGPGDPGPGGYPPGKSGGGPSKPLIAAAAALVTVAVGAVVFVVWPNGDEPSKKPAPRETPAGQQPVAQEKSLSPGTKEQATALNAVLDDSVGTRRILAAAISRAGKCKTLPQAIQGFQTVAQQRQNQLARTRRLQVTELTKGERLRTSLAEALTASLQVDQVLLQWAQQNQRDCRGKPRPSAAQVPGRAAIERRATAAKKRFVVLWNPVAEETGQPKRSWRRV
ncbi:hypothetical protein [Actinomadura spongiicola]|uniref:hypothetical protein n=1 Tax=Actinomadura spongiicola TaxID=2303421 RepID=UPI00131433E6|nr:hypothetical protein [Actinomadura spongiicola]